MIPLLSRPTRACGLKLRHFEKGTYAILSRPTRACGLKPQGVVSLFVDSVVTPHTGVWIETFCVNPLCFKTSVTPHTGVWIETQRPSERQTTYKSRPTRACGLKHTEIYTSSVQGQSRPTRACGLKQPPYAAIGEGVQSRPTRACGLKLDFKALVDHDKRVTPHTGVWIETRGRRCWRTRRHCHAPHGACGLKRCVTKMLLTIVFVSL